MLLPPFAAALLAVETADDRMRALLVQGILAALWALFTGVAVVGAVGMIIRNLAQTPTYSSHRLGRFAAWTNLALSFASFALLFYRPSVDPSFWPAFKAFAGMAGVGQLALAIGNFAATRAAPPPREA